MRVWTALSIVYVVWGSTYLAIVYVVESLPPLLGAALRFGSASVLLAAFLLVRRGGAGFRGSPRQWVTAGGIGLLLLAGGNGGVTLAEARGLPSGLAALLVASLPLMVVLLRLLDHDRPSRSTVVGVGIGFVGLAVLLQPGSRPEGVSVLAAALVLLGTVSWALGSFAATKLDLPPDQLTVTLAEMLGGFVGLLVVGLLRGERLDVGAVEAQSWWGLAYLSVFGSIVAFTAYSWLLANAPVSQVATYAYVNPVVAVALGAVFVDEAVTGTTLLGGAITLLAVAVVVTAEGRRRTAPPPPPEAGVEDYSPTERQGLERSSAT